MTTSELKLRIFRQIDALEKDKLEGLYGVITNYINGQNEIADWTKLSEVQKQGILDAIDDIDNGNGIPDKVVMENFRNKYSHG